MSSSRGSALLIIDMQNDFVLQGAPMCVAGAKATIPAVQELVEFACENGWKIFYVIREHDKSGCDVEPYRKHFFENGAGGFCVPGSYGAKIVQELEVCAQDYIIVKKRNSAFFKTNLDEILKSLAVKNVVICGTQYPNCIRATANDAMSFDYDVTICTDATSAQSQEVAAANICDLQNMGIPCLTLEEIKNVFN